MKPFKRARLQGIRVPAGVWLLMCLCAASTAERISADDPSTVPGAHPAGQLPRSTGEELILRFRQDPSCQSQVVRLGDLVEVANAHARVHDDLLEIPLAPAPQIGATQPWSARDVLRHLQLRGLTQKQLRWSGAESVTLKRIAEVAPTADRTKLVPAFVQERTLSQAATNVAQATREYLWLQTGERTEWRISVEVPPEHANALSQRRNIETVSGGAAPWIGEQAMVFSYKHQGKKFEVSLPVLIELPITVVVAARPIRRDEVIDASALEYAPLPERMMDEAGEFFTDFDQIAGKQLRRSISSGLPIPKSAIGEPIVVSNGELVEIESIAGSVSVKTAARALSGGAVGELINVELLSTRKRLAAIVVGPLQVRVASGPSISRNPTSPTTRSPGTDASRTANRLSQDVSLR